MSTGSTGSAGDSKVETIARLGQWRIESFGPCSYRRSDSFKLGIWNWHLSVEKNRVMLIRLYPEPCRLTKEQPPLARFVLRVSNTAPGRRCCVSPVHEKVLRGSDDFVWQVDSMFHGRFTVDVEFLDLKIASIIGGEPSPIWPDEGMLQSLASRSSLCCLSRMLSESIHTDVMIHTSDGNLLAHKAVLSATSPVFASMFLHDLRENQSSTIDINDMSLGSCSALLGYIYGDINQDDFWKHRVALLAAADKYDITDLKNCCEESLVEDIGLENVLERLQEAWLYRLARLKKACMSYLFEFGKIHDLRDEIDVFFRQADRELMVEMFHEILAAWKPI
ncbi:BTB/POZ domain-containing protein [Rhynchospora pubera]|uniref:BTB/POZ domain-containing protein n=1 Tax=Rhynchospora pubera TaxID=906938 RepID=A0AAV8DSN3_9POAL|nr:BTB/POZ domain-containing protein [Rhynchospora pubera]